MPDARVASGPAGTSANRIDAPWPAPLACRPLAANVTVPGSKSMTARCLVLAHLAAGPSYLRGVLRSRDTDLMMAALSALGSQIADQGPDLVITPAGMPRGLQGGSRSGLADGASAARSRSAQGDAACVDVGLAGTVMRFVPPLAALGTTPVRFDGDHQARTRPMAPLLNALERLGAGVTYHHQTGHLPFTIRGPLGGGHLTLDSQASSQFASALLLVAPALPDGLDLELVPPRLPSRPHVEMTLHALQRFGANLTAMTDTHWVVQAGGLTGQSLTIEPDLSNAAPFLAAAMVAGGQVTIEDWPATTTQPGGRLIDYLTKMGALVAYNRQDQTLTLTGRSIKGVDLDLSPAGELTPTLAALATLAEGPSRLTGIAHLRGHETNRLAALTCEINRLGGQASELPDGLAITPKPLHGATIETYHDHRMATFGAIIGLRVPGVNVKDMATTAKTMPDFPQLWASMLEGGRG